MPRSALMCCAYALFIVLVAGLSAAPAAAAKAKLCAFRSGPSGPCSCKTTKDGPGEFTSVDVLARNEADAALIIASDPMAHFPYGAAEHLKRIPTILMTSMPNCSSEAAKVILPTACYGVDAPGTFYRMDNVALRLRSVLPNAKPTDEEILLKMIEAVK